MGAAETVVVAGELVVYALMAAADVPTVGAMLVVEIESGDLETVAADARTAATSTGIAVTGAEADGIE